MSFDFSYDGRTFHLDTDKGEVHCKEVEPKPAAPQPLEPSEDAA